MRPLAAVAVLLCLGCGGKPPAKLSPAIIDFGLVPHGSVGEEHFFVVNPTDQLLRVELEAPEGFTPSEPAVVLEPGERRLLVLTFSPTEEGASMGKVRAGEGEMIVVGSGFSAQR